LIRIDLEIATLREDIASGKRSRDEARADLAYLLREREWLVKEMSKTEAEKPAESKGDF
jgi:hypothetical protein